MADPVRCPELIAFLAAQGALHARQAHAEGQDGSAWGSLDWLVHLAEERDYLEPRMPQRVRGRLERSRASLHLLLLAGGMPAEGLGRHVGLEEALLRALRATPPAEGCIYLDNNATTPVDPRVAAVVERAMLRGYGNPHSADHQYGDRAKDSIERARRWVAELCDCAPSEVYFTSGATESIRLGIDHATRAITKRQGAPCRIVAMPAEHRAVLSAIERAEEGGQARARFVDLDERGRIDEASLARELAAGCDLFVCMAANNEVGNVYPIASLAALARQVGAETFSDGTQAVGKVPVSVRDASIAYMPLSGHKLYGPKGVGALVVRGGGSGDGFEEPGGTPNVPGIVGLGEAARLRLREMHDDEARIASLRDRLEQRLVEAGAVVNGDVDCQLPGTLHVSLLGVPNDALLALLRDRVALSTGAACASGRGAASHVLAAMHLPDERKESAVRIGIGKFNTADEIEAAARLITAAARSLRG